MVRCAISLLLLAAAPATAGTPSIHADQLYGCWAMDRPDSGSSFGLTSIASCFGANGMAEGVTMDDGDGWDWTVSWRLDGDRLVLDGDPAHACTIAWGPGRTFGLSGCGWEGRYAPACAAGGLDGDGRYVCRARF